MRFLVDGYGEVRLVGYDDAVSRYDAYDVTPSEIRDRNDLGCVIDRVTELRMFVQGFSWDDEQDDYSLADYDPDLVSEYVDGLPPADYNRLIGEIEEWFSAPISADERYSYDIMRPIDGAAIAYALFTHGDLWDAVEPLGLVEIDGASPTHDYRGIALVGTLEPANAAAKTLDLPIRFERDDG